MIEIKLNNIIKNYGLKNVLNGMNLTLKTGERVAIIGYNGAGKSTVFKIIMKQESISSGTISIRKNATIGMLKQIYEYEEKINLTMLSVGRFYFAFYKDKCTGSD